MGFLFGTLLGSAKTLELDGPLNRSLLFVLNMASSQRSTSFVTSHAKRATSILFVWARVLLGKFEAKVFIVTIEVERFSVTVEAQMRT
jgi:hypothetical protein